MNVYAGNALKMENVLLIFGEENNDLVEGFCPTLEANTS